MRLAPIPKRTDKGERAAARELLEGFDVTPYLECEKWGVSEWTVALEFRHLLEVQLRHLHDVQPIYGPYDPKFVSSALKVIRDYPTSLEFLDRVLDPVTPAVRDMTVADLMWAFDDFAHPGDRDKEIGSKTLREIRSDPRLMSHSIDEACLARGRSPLPNDQLAVTVDLSKTDDDLKQDFADWLNKRRHDGASTGLDWWRRFDIDVFKKWHRNRVLACIDLELQANAACFRLTHRQVASALYPEVALDLTERIRKTVRPLAEQVLSWHTVSALNAAAQ